MPTLATDESRPKEYQRAAVNSEQKQKTISELFAASKSTSGRPNTADLQHFSPRKRLKHTQTASSSIEGPANAAARMNNTPSTPSFPTPSSIGTTSTTEIIDLTGSPSPAPFRSSPARKRLSGTVRPTSFAPTGGPKKLIVKNLRTTPKTNPDQFYDQVWGQLDTALSAICTGGILPCSLEELYKGVESLCKQDRAPPLYKKLREKCRHNLSVQVLEPLIQHASTASTIDLLESVVKAWATWQSQLVSTVCRICMIYLMHSRLPFAQFFSTLIGLICSIHLP